MGEQLKEAIVWALMVVIVAVTVCVTVTVNRGAVRALDQIEYSNVTQYGVTGSDGWTKTRDVRVVWVDGHPYEEWKSEGK
jgi:hypothetical protein